MNIAHTFTRPFVNGWGLKVINPINIIKIEEINLRKRFFCIIDREYPFTLKIKYNKPNISNIPIIMGNGAIYNMVDINEFSYMTLRFKTLVDANFEMQSINNMSKCLKRILEKEDERIKKELDVMIKDYHLF